MRFTASGEAKLIGYLAESDGGNLFSELSHEADQLKLMRCLRRQLKSSAEAAIILEQSRAIQGIPKTTRELKAERGKVWTRLFFSTLFLSLIFNAIDIGSDTLILIRYWRELSRGELLAGPAHSNSNFCFSRGAQPGGGRGGLRDQHVLQIGQ